MPLVVSVVFGQEIQVHKVDTLGTSSQPQYQFEPIVVTTARIERSLSRVPYSIEIIGQNEIQRAEVGLSLNEVLRLVPGVVVNNRYNLSQGDRISIRGVGSLAPFGVRGIKIILDGIPLTMPDGQAQLNNLDLGSTGKIEVLRGPSSSMYGNAAGGLIKIRTQSASASPFLFQPRFVTGADGLWKWQGKISGNIGGNTYLVNVNKLRFQGYRDHSSASSTSVNAVSRHDLSNRIRMTTVFNYFDAPYLLNPSSLSKTDAEM